METIHVEKRTYKGYSIGICLEYPGIITWDRGDDSMLKQFKDLVISHKAALKRHGMSDRPEVEVFAVDVPEVI